MNRLFGSTWWRRQWAGLVIGLLALGGPVGCGSNSPAGGGGAAGAAANADGQPNGQDAGGDGLNPAAQGPWAGPDVNPGPSPAGNPPNAGPGEPAPGGPAGGGENSFTPGLVAGDRYDIEADTAAADQLGRDIWAVLHESNNLCWQARTNALQQYQFYEDPSFAAGPLMRYNGFDVIAGAMAVHSVGWYYLPDRAEPYMAALVNTWQDGWELIVIEDNDTMVHTWWTGGGSPFATYYDGSGQNCL